MAATLQPKATALAKVCPSDKATAKAPLKTSPAAVVSTALAFGAGINCSILLLQINAPSAPSVMITVSTPLALIIAAAAFTLTSPVMLTPDNISASFLFGVIMAICLNNSSGSAQAGAGFKITLFSLVAVFLFFFVFVFFRF